MGSLTDRFRIPAGAAALALLVTLAAAGCSTHAPVAHGPSAETDVPLQVWLPAHDLHAGPWAVFHVNKPAYVAIFDIVPGLGARALYPHDPAAGGQRRFHTGIQTVLAGHGPGSGFARNPGLAPFSACRGSLHSPVAWRLIVASERPLDLRSLRPFVAFRYRPAVGGLHLAGGSVFHTMDDILHAVLPPGAAPDPGAGLSEWAVDYLPYWTSPRPCLRAVHLAAVTFKRPIRARTRFPGRDSATAEGGDGEGREGDGESREVDLDGLEERIAETVANLPGRADPEGRGGTAKPRLRDEGDRTAAGGGRPGERPGEAEDAAVPDAPLRGWAPERRPGGRALERGDAGTRSRATEARPVKRRTLLPPRADPRGFDHAVGRDRSRVGERSADRLRYLPNARVPARAVRDGPRRGATPGTGVRTPGASARPRPASQARPVIKPVRRPSPPARPAPKTKDRSSSGDRDAQR